MYRDYAATLNEKEQGLSAEAIATAGMAQMSEKFKALGNQVYVDEATAVKESNKAL